MSGGLEDREWGGEDSLEIGCFWGLERFFLCRAWGLKVHRYLRKEVSVAQITPQGLLAHKEEQPGLRGGVR